MNKIINCLTSILFILFVSLLTECKKEKVIVITTTSVSQITATTAISGGDITNDGGSIITARGVCWSTSANPTITDNKTTDGTGNGSFVSSITGLTPVTTYHLRAYATNSAGTAYGNEISFASSSSTSAAGAVIDIDGNGYNIINIGTQVWLKENLKTTRYSNGDSIGTTTPASFDITYEDTPKYQWAYDGDVNNVSVYGRLYTWYAATDNRNICPTGWHVPTDEEWTTLTDYLISLGIGYGENVTFIAKALAATSGWAPDGTAGHVGNDQTSNNSTGFSAIPGGFRYSNGTYTQIGEMAAWWSSTEFNVINIYAWGRYLVFNSSEGYKNYLNKQSGWSVRCLRNF
jgi:uncharacterized protein (TIGR02145 family)